VAIIFFSFPARMSVCHNVFSVGFSFSAFVLVTTMTSHSFYTHNVKKEKHQQKAEELER